MQLSIASPAVIKNDEYDPLFNDVINELVQCSEEHIIPFAIEMAKSYSTSRVIGVIQRIVNIVKYQFDRKKDISYYRESITKSIYKIHDDNVDMDRLDNAKWGDYVDYHFNTNISRILALMDLLKFCKDIIHGDKVISFNMLQSKINNCGYKITIEDKPEFKKLTSGIWSAPKKDNTFKELGGDERIFDKWFTLSIDTLDLLDYHCTTITSLLNRITEIDVSRFLMKYEKAGKQLIDKTEQWDSTTFSIVYGWIFVQLFNALRDVRYSLSIVANRYCNEK